MSKVIDLHLKCPNCNCDLEMNSNILKVKDKKILLIDDDHWYSMNTIDKDKYIVLGHIESTRQHRVLEK